eukprot:TRINITY_DN34202_c0_g1_i1.p1 TRINITY_DN34202_c0_g1~~TRINITY_DN34202_c0_g1_i1.p1  ORF type:complete len:1096 (+),score=121.26 TRINITY_DN34202_c0_g1_i1:172-3288(+)
MPRRSRPAHGLIANTCKNRRTTCDHRSTDLLGTRSACFAAVPSSVNKAVAAVVPSLSNVDCAVVPRPPPVPRPTVLPKRSPGSTSATGCEGGVLGYLKVCTIENKLPKLHEVLMSDDRRGTLNLSYTDLSDRVLESILDSLATRVVSVSVLDLSHNSLVNGLSHLLGTIFPQAPGRSLAEHALPKWTLDILDLSHNPLSPGSVQGMAKHLHVKHLQVRSLRLAGVTLGSGNIAFLCMALRRNGSVVELVLAGTQIGRHGQEDCELVAQLSGTVERLDLSHNYFRADGFAALGQSLASPTSIVKELSLSENVWCGASSSPDSGCQSDGKAPTDGLDNNPVVSFCEALGRNQSLTALDLSGCHSDQRAAMCLEDALGRHPRLRRVDLSRTPLGFAGFRAVVRSLADGRTAFRELVATEVRSNPLEPNVLYDPEHLTGAYCDNRALCLELPHHRAVLRLLLRRGAELGIGHRELLREISMDGELQPNFVERHTTTCTKRPSGSNIVSARKTLVHAVNETSRNQRQSKHATSKTRRKESAALVQTATSEEAFDESSRGTPQSVASENTFEVPTRGLLTFAFSMEKDVGSGSNAKESCVGDIVETASEAVAEWHTRRRTQVAWSKFPALAKLWKSQHFEQDRCYFLMALLRDLSCNLTQVLHLVQQVSQTTPVLVEEVLSHSFPTLVFVNMVAIISLMRRGYGEKVTQERVQMREGHVVKSLRQVSILGRLNVGSPTGRYSFGIRLPADRAAADRLLVATRWEAALSARLALPDTTEAGGYVGIRNFTVDDAIRPYRADSSLVDATRVAFDYVTPLRPKRKKGGCSKLEGLALPEVHFSELMSTVRGEATDTKWVTRFRAIWACADRFFLDAKQLRHLVGSVPVEWRVEFYVMLMPRCLDFGSPTNDVTNGVLADGSLFDTEAIEQIGERLGPANIFDPIGCHREGLNSYHFDLSKTDQRLCFELLLKLAKLEGKKQFDENFRSVRWAGSLHGRIARVPASWLKSAPQTGEIQLNYHCKREKVLLAVRQRLAREMLGWIVDTL